MKELLAIFAIAFAINAFAAQENIEIWTSSEPVKKAIENATTNFSKDYGAKITITVLSKDVTSLFKTAAVAGKGPDIFVWAHDVIGDLAESGLIEPVVLSPDLKKAFLPVTVNAFTYKGKVYGYPYDLEALALIYNKKFIQKAPSSMEEVVKYSLELKAKNKGEYGFLYDLNNFFFSFPFLSANGGYVFKDNNGTLNAKDVGLNNDGALKGLEFIKSLKEKDIVPSSTDRSAAFTKMKEGKLVMTVDGPWAIAELKQNNINYGVAPIPSLSGKKPRPFVGTHGFIIRRSSKNKDLAKILIEQFLVTKQGVMALYKADPRGPARTDVINELADKNPDLKAFMESAKEGIPMPNIPAMGAVWNAMGSALSLTISGKEPPKSALDHAQKQILSQVK